MRSQATTLALLLACACAPPPADTPDGVPDDVPADALPVEDRGDLARDQHCEIAPPPPGVRTVQVVFSCDEVPVGSWRVVDDATTDSLTFALQALLAGPTVEERASGLFSFFSTETAGMLNRTAVRDGIAYVDLADFSRIIPNASTSAGSAQLLDQLAGTIFQFDGISEAEITFDGSCLAFWNWLQRDCERLTRSDAT